MLNLSFCGNSNFNESLVLTTLRENERRLRLMVNIPCLYFGNFPQDVAEARLTMWYLAELFADHGEVNSVKDTELVDGSADVEFLVTVREDMADPLVKKLAWMAPVFDSAANDDHDDISAFDFGSEIFGWAEEREVHATRFPKLREAYEADLAIALEDETADEADE